MSDLYTTLRVSPKKKRVFSDDEDESVVTPKRLRASLPSPKTISSKSKTVKGSSGSSSASSPDTLPPHLARLYKLQISMQHALSHALATCAVSPSSDTGIVHNVLNHHTLNTYAGLTTKLEVDDLKRLCWLWEWDGKRIPPSPGPAKEPRKVDEENPFLDKEEDEESRPQPKDWSRGGMGFVVGPASHFSKSAGSRIPAYGIGIEVEMDIDKEMGSGMASVARWTAASETRRREVLQKLHSWVKLHTGTDPTPNLYMADLPQLIVTVKPSKLTKLLASSSPRASTSSIPSILTAPPSPTSPSKSKRPSSPLKSPQKPFAVPFPVTPASKDHAAGAKNSIAFPQTPSSTRRSPFKTGLLTPQRTPSSSPTRGESSLPVTPVHQKGSDAATAPETPSSSRRNALYERIRQKSLTSSPTKPGSSANPSTSKSGNMSKEQFMKLGQDEMRRRVLLGRLGGVADSVWMLFNSPMGASTTPSTTRKRKALPSSEVAAAVVKSSSVPVSSAEAQESLDLLTSLCPFFLKPLDIGGEDWLEMPAPAQASSGSSSSTDGGSPSKATPPSPGPGRGKDDSANELLMRSPRTVKKEGGGLREVRERIRRELELAD